MIQGIRPESKPMVQELQEYYSPVTAVTKGAA